MAERIISAGSTAPIPRERGHAPLFALSAKYLIDASSETSALGVDVGCMFESLLATIQATIDASEGDPHIDGLLFSALYWARQASGTSAEYIVRTAPMLKGQGATETATEASGAAERGHTAPDTTATALKSASSASPTTDLGPQGRLGAMDSALNAAAFAHRGISVTLEQLHQPIYRDCDSAAQGLYEAAVASAAAVDRAIGQCLEAAGGAQ